MKKHLDHASDCLTLAVIKTKADQIEIVVPDQYVIHKGEPDVRPLRRFLRCRYDNVTVRLLRNEEQVGGMLFVMNPAGPPTGVLTDRWPENLLS